MLPVQGRRRRACFDATAENQFVRVREKPAQTGGLFGGGSLPSSARFCRSLPRQAGRRAIYSSRRGAGRAIIEATAVRCRSSGRARLGGSQSHYCITRSRLPGARISHWPPRAFGNQTGRVGRRRRSLITLRIVRHACVREKFSTAKTAKAAAAGFYRAPIRSADLAGRCGAARRGASIGRLATCELDGRATGSAGRAPAREPVVCWASRSGWRAPPWGCAEHTHGRKPMG